MGGRYSSGIWTFGRFGAGIAAPPSTVAGTSGYIECCKKEKGTDLLQPSSLHGISVSEDSYTEYFLRTKPGSEEGGQFKRCIDLLLCSARRALCASRSSASTAFTTASDLVLANDICYAIHDFTICSSSNSDDGMGTYHRFRIQGKSLHILQSSACTILRSKGYECLTPHAQIAVSHHIEDFTVRLE